jgi:hypothetical protein
VIYTYWVPPGATAKIVNPSWTEAPAVVCYGTRTAACLSREQASLDTRKDALLPIHCELPLVVEWYLDMSRYYLGSVGVAGDIYTGVAATELRMGTFAGRWALGGDWLYSGILTIQDRSAKANDPGYSNRPLQVFGASGDGYGPSQVMEVGASTLHHLQDWWRLKDKAEPHGHGWWTVDFEWAEGAAWSLLRHKLGTDTKTATHVAERLPTTPPRRTWPWTHLQGDTGP